MTEEEYFRKTYPDSCYGDRPLSPHWDFFQDGVEFGERQSEEKIEELEKENMEWEKASDKWKNLYYSIKKENEDLKELVKKLLNLKVDKSEPMEKVLHYCELAEKLGVEFQEEVMLVSIIWFIINHYTDSEILWKIYLCVVPIAIAVDFWLEKKICDKWEKKGK